ncbi:MAG: VOC family protein [Nitrososphaerales archaeon]
MEEKESPYNKIVHVELKVLDLDRAKEFYSQLFGWKTYKLPENDQVIFRVSKGVGGSFIKVNKVEKGGILFYVCVDDLEKYLKRIRALGGKIVKEGEPLAGGIGYTALFEDSEGNLIGLYMPILNFPF